MSGPVLLGIYRPGTSVLHRLPVGPKMLGLLALGIAVVAVRGAPSAAAFLVAALLLAAIGRIGFGTTVRALRPLVVAVVLIGAFQAWQRGWGSATEAVCDLLALVLASTVLTATTPVNSILDAVVSWLSPFRRWGVEPQKVALAFSLMIRAVPGTLEIAQETRDAARARGLERHPRALLVPMVLRTVARAHETGAALTARGIGED